jgi:hypothetical protein
VYIGILEETTQTLVRIVHPLSFYPGGEKRVIERKKKSNLMILYMDRKFCCGYPKKRFEHAEHEYGNTWHHYFESQ